MTNARLVDLPRITPERIARIIRREQYHVFPGTTVTICCLTLANGFRVTGESQAESPLAFDEETGRQKAKADARKKVVMLENYRLFDALTNDTYEGH